MLSFRAPCTSGPTLATQSHGVMNSVADAVPAPTLSGSSLGHSSLLCRPAGRICCQDCSLDLFCCQGHGHVQAQVALGHARCCHNIQLLSCLLRQVEVGQAHGQTHCLRHAQTAAVRNSLQPANNLLLVELAAQPETPAAVPARILWNPCPGATLLTALTASAAAAAPAATASDLPLFHPQHTQPLLEA